MENTPPFYWTKISDVGASHPIIARISSGVPDLINLWQVSEDKKKQIRNLCHDIAKDLIEAEKQALPIIEEIEAIEANLKKTRPTKRPNFIESVLSIENTRSYLKFAKDALKTFAVLLGIIFDEGFTNPKFKDISDRLEKKFSFEIDKKYLILELLKYYQPFADDLVRRRNEDEHGHYSKTFISNYEIKENEGVLILQRPCFSDKVPIFEYLKHTQHLLLHFIEEALVASISIDLHPIVAICEIPENKRNPQFPKRFRLELVGNLDSPQSDL